MSYFPCDIPFMSDDELKENGIHIPKNVSDTNVGKIEYIGKKEAIDAVEFGITTAWAIDIASGEKKELFASENEELQKAVDRIRNLTSADVVSVIRCKDCTNAIFNKLDGRKYCVAGFEKTIASAYVAIGNPIFARRDDDFCSYGKRREE